MTGIVIRQEARAGRITLARPAALNALTHGMIREILRVLDAWAEDPGIALILIDAESDRAFCAGGDLTAIYATGLAGDFAPGRRFWIDEYTMNARIARFPKPVVALMQGYVMGGGVGIGGNASHRVVGATTRMAMPECMIGLVPDVGASDLLARAPGRLGEYLGLTGHRMDPGETLAAGFADHFVPEARWPELGRRLAAEGEPAAIGDAAEPAPPAPLAEHRAAIDAAFGHETLAGIRDALPATDWGYAIGAALEGGCPLSLACTLALIRAARAEPGIERALAREFRFSWRAASEGELLEGIRAAVIDKDRTPRWRDTIASLDPDRVARMLAPLGRDEFALPALGD